MTDGNEHRREADSEAFKYQIVAEQATIRTKVELMHDMIKMELGSLKEKTQDHKLRLETLEKAIVGSTAEPGLLEKNRNIAKDVAKLFGYISLAGVILWKIISPMYDAWVSRWASHQIATEVAQQPQPKSKLVRSPK